MRCIFGCGTVKGRDRGCAGHPDAETLTVDCDAEVKPNFILDLTTSPHQELTLRQSTCDEVIFEALPIDVAGNINTWKNAVGLLKQGGLLKIRTGNYDLKNTLEKLEICADETFPLKDGKFVYEVTDFGVEITLTYFSS